MRSAHPRLITEKFLVCSLACRLLFYGVIVMLYLYMALVILLSLLVSLGGSRWVDRLYEQNRDILTFPDAIQPRSRWRKPAVAILFAILGIRYLFITSGFPLVLMLGGTALLLLMMMTDFEQYCLFDQMMLCFAVGGLACSAIAGMDMHRVIAAVAGGAVFLLISILTRGALGGGDIKLIACLGLWFGPGPLLMISLFGILTGGISALFMLLLGKKKRKSAFAYGPYFIIGALGWMSLYGI